MKVAIYKNTDYDYETVKEVGGWIDEDDEHIRISEAVEISFVMLDKSETVRKEVNAIDGQIKKVQAATQIKLNELEQKKAELLAIPDLTGEKG